MATEREEMQMTESVVALQSLRHSTNQKPHAQHRRMGHPPASTCGAINLRHRIFSPSLAVNKTKQNKQRSILPRRQKSSAAGCGCPTRRCYACGSWGALPPPPRRPIHHHHNRRGGNLSAPRDRRTRNQKPLPVGRHSVGVIV